MDDSRQINPYKPSESSVSESHRPIRNSPPDFVKGLVLLESIFLTVRLLILAASISGINGELHKIDWMQAWLSPYRLSYIAMLVVGIPSTLGMLWMKSWAVRFGWAYFSATVLSMGIEFIYAAYIDEIFLIYMFWRGLFLFIFHYGLLKFAALMRASSMAPD